VRGVLTYRNERPDGLDRIGDVADVFFEFGFEFVFEFGLELLTGLLEIL
jgi:hypothetical protein